MLRKVLIWIVVALLPVQGYAAAAMISCGPMHARMLAGVSQDSAHGQVQAAHDHATHDHATHGHAAAVPDTQEDAPDLADVTNFKCSACASCCTAPAAPSSSLMLVRVTPAHSEAIPFFPTSEDTIVPDGLERPPRQYLA